MGLKKKKMEEIKCKISKDQRVRGRVSFPVEEEGISLVGWGMGIVE